MATRYDLGQVQKSNVTTEGFLVLEGTATRIGVFEYRNPDGSIRRELRHPDDVIRGDSLSTLGSKPVTLEHPSELLTPKNVKEHSIGSVNNQVVEEHGLIKVVMNIHREDGVNDINDGTRSQLSCGYTCDLENTPGEWNGIHFDARQRNIVYNHLALVKVARGGPQCKLRLDSDQDEFGIAIQGPRIEDTPPEGSEGEVVTFSVEEKQDSGDAGDTGTVQNSKKAEQMTTTRLTIDGIQYDDVPIHLAQIFSQKMQQNRLDSDAQGSLSQENEQLKQQLATMTTERDRQQGRADALEIANGELNAEVGDLESELERLDVGSAPATAESTNSMQADPEGEGVFELDQGMDEDEMMEMEKKKMRKGKKDGGSRRFNAKKADATKKDGPGKKVSARSFVAPEEDDERNDAFEAELNARMQARQDSTQLRALYGVDDCRYDSDWTADDIRAQTVIDIMLAHRPHLDGLDERPDKWYEYKWDSLVEEAVQHPENQYAQGQQNFDSGYPQQQEQRFDATQQRADDLETMIGVSRSLQAPQQQQTIYDPNNPQGGQGGNPWQQPLNLSR